MVLVKSVTSFLVFQCIFLLAISVQAQDEFPESEGYYVKSGGGYTALGEFNAIRFGFDKLKDIVSVQRNNDDLYIHVYKKKWQLEKAFFYTKSLTIINHDLYDRQSPKVKDLGEGHYLLIFPKITANQVLFVQDWTGEYAITLANPEQELVVLFNQPNEKAYAVLANLKEALKSYPNNRELRNLLPRWEAARELETENRDWVSVKDDWAKYEGTQNVKNKVIYLNSVKKSVEAYLVSYPSGVNKQHAEKLLNTINQEVIIKHK